MGKRPRTLLIGVSLGLFLLCVALTLLLATERPALLLPASLILVLILVSLLVSGRALRQRITEVLAQFSPEQQRARDTLDALPTPALLLSGKTVLWYNSAFRRSILHGEEAALSKVNRVLPGLDIAACSGCEGQCLPFENRLYIAFAGLSGQDDPLTLVYLVDETELRRRSGEYLASRPAYMLIEIDGYASLSSDMTDSERASLLEGVTRTLEDFIGRTTGFLCRVSSSRFVAVVEERHMRSMIDGHFEVLDKVRALNAGGAATLSIGVGHAADSLAECQQMAVQSLDMALGRGGDQAAVKTADGFEFYGGVSRSVERRSKVKSRVIASALVEAIRRSDSVVIMGHRTADLDAVGAAIGVLRICKICDVPAVIAIRSDTCLAKSLLEAFDEAGESDNFIHPQLAYEAVTPQTLVVVVDTYLKNLVESPEICEKSGRIVVIDHHRKAVGHFEDTEVLYHEPYASSASELVSELLQYVPDHKTDKLTALEAEALLAGIMLDTRNFALHCGVRTFEAAAFLRRMGALPESARRLFDGTLEEYAARAALVERAQNYRGCAISASPALPPDMAVAIPQAANELLTIVGVVASFVLVQKENDVVISARSMGALNVQVVLERLGGGGHLTMAGAQLRGVVLEDAVAQLKAAIDTTLDNQKHAEEAESKRSGKLSTLFHHSSVN